MRISTVLPLVVLASATLLGRNESAVRCPIIFDGRVLTNLTLAALDTTTSPYSPRYVKGENLTWSSIILFPPTTTPRSRFDTRSIHKPFEVTINDSSIFRAGSSGLQVGFRRAGLLLADDANPVGSDAADKGVVTFHWSVRQDEHKPLNLSHEYMNVWHEKAEYSGNQFTFVGGVVLKQDGGGGGNGADTPEERNSWKVQDANNTVVFRTPILSTGWQNFAIGLDYANSTMQVLYSTNGAPLKAVTAAVPNDNSGGGQLQLGIAKKPTETESVVYDGYQESIVGSEGQIYGGVFVEDSSGGCVSV
ncbi:glycoside hydrolase family 131 protein [Pleomassaria siparia CBS 279.74]|uniref:Glycoside hydrolase family 131 protein n=1 Tax=Pleomassaria siparia CBS 279.74 TaxID=1314801 RepID=A0A6G1JWL4_9PLEO|nr:glycoside hydrolase family 131 protein [Pleomassaria siparia CBS 279.74]